MEKTAIRPIFIPGRGSHEPVARDADSHPRRGTEYEGLSIFLSGGGDGNAPHPVPLGAGEHRAEAVEDGEGGCGGRAPDTFPSSRQGYGSASSCSGSNPGPTTNVSLSESQPTAKAPQSGASCWSMLTTNSLLPL